MKIYTGKVLTTGEVQVIVTIEGLPKVRYSLSHIMFHSLGMEWGYSGSGPSDLALSLLADYFAESPEQVIRYGNFGRMGLACSQCGGDGWLVDDAYEDGVGMVSTAVDCTACEDGTVYPPVCKSWELHHEFLWQIVTHWPQGQDWELSGTEIEAFLALRLPGSLPAPEVEG